ncbi:MAG TPA: VCBS repeat-containing protein [Nocardioidaceae bacterium]|nr:VCBS repeat-containing protein [Nocardioidaceae bacterium]
MRLSRVIVVGLGCLLVAGVVPGAQALVDDEGGGGAGSGASSAVASTTSRVERAAASCATKRAPHPVRRPKFVRNITTGETGWFASPGLVDLNGDGRKEIVAPFYSTFVFDAKGHQLGKGTATDGRVYAPEAVADLDGDGRKEIVVGGSGSVAAYDLVHGRLKVKRGWPASVRSGGQTPEVRGLAAADLNHDGRVEVVATTTNTSPTGAQVFVFNARGKRFQPKHGHHPAWPRYNRLRGPGNDLHFNGMGNHGYGAFGENVGIGNIDNDPDLEIITTFDNHQINAFNLDGTSILASKWFTNRESGFDGRRMGWGQFIRWADPGVERRHYHLHTGAWPSPARQAWLQWTASPPSVADIDRDGRNEVIGIPNVERHIPYRTQGYAFMVLDGAYGDKHRSAMRHKGFEKLPMSNHPVFRPDGDWYPPSGIPAPTVVDILGNRQPEIVSALPGGKVYAVGPSGHKLWSYEYAPRRSKTFASEVVAADLNKDGTPELVFGTYSLHRNAGRLIVLSAKGKPLSVTRLRHQGRDGNGIGVPAAPSIADLTGDGTLEIVLTTFDHGIDVYTVPGSGTGCLSWPTGRGNLLRNGMGPATAP